MLLLYQKCVGHFPIHVIHLHSIMLLLYRQMESNIMCQHQNLHSIMLLLYLDLDISIHLNAGFTFHYASTLSGSEEFQMFQDFIYIPLCFYFIYACRTSTAYIYSIYIPLCFYFIEELGILTQLGFRFTFHYASTLSAGYIRTNSERRYLHSIMPLLYQNDAKWFHRENLHLHSIMLLLYLIINVLFAANTSFTFHYASTLSGIW